MVQQFPDAKTERPKTTSDKKSQPSALTEQPAATSLKQKETAIKISEEGKKTVRKVVYQFELYQNFINNNAV